MHGESVLKVALKIFMSLHKFDYEIALAESLHGFGALHDVLVRVWSLHSGYGLCIWSLFYH